MVRMKYIDNKTLKFVIMWLLPEGFLIISAYNKYGLIVGYLLSEKSLILFISMYAVVSKCFL